MSDPTAQEPTMEEILASIRRIISEDDAPAEAPAAAAPAPVAAREPEPVVHAPPPAAHHEEEEDEDVLELNEPAPHSAAETHGDLGRRLFAAAACSRAYTRAAAACGRGP